MESKTCNGPTTGREPNIREKMDVIFDIASYRTKTAINT
jgi:hypothetical protein